MNLNNWQTQLRKGLLDIVVLNYLSHGQSHGYEMVQSLKAVNGLDLREGNIYPILARLETDGLVNVEKKPSPEGPPRKYYEITEKGRQALEQMNLHWNTMIQAMSDIQKGDNR